MSTTRRGKDSKPRTLRPGQKAPGTRAARRAVQARNIRHLEDAHSTGEIRLWDYSPSGSHSGLVVGVIGPQGGISGNPAMNVAYAIRRALRPRPKQADCIVYDANGQRIATIDGVTRERHVVKEQQ